MRILGGQVNLWPWEQRQTASVASADSLAPGLRLPGAACVTCGAALTCRLVQLQEGVTPETRATQEPHSVTAITIDQFSGIPHICIGIAEWHICLPVFY